MPIRLNGEEGTPAWCARQNTKNFERIAIALERIANLEESKK